MARAGAIAGEGGGQVALRPLHVADLVVADGEVALPVGIAGIGAGEALGRSEGALVRLQRGGEVSDRDVDVAERDPLPHIVRCDRKQRLQCGARGGVVVGQPFDRGLLAQQGGLTAVPLCLLALPFLGEFGLQSCQRGGGVEPAQLLACRGDGGVDIGAQVRRRGLARAIEDGGDCLFRIRPHLRHRQVALAEMLEDRPQQLWLDASLARDRRQKFGLPPLSQRAVLRG